MCLEGARAVAQLLSEHPTAKLRVWVIWTPRLLPDDRDEWDPQVLDDPRVTHAWDQSASVARDLARRTAGYQGPDWDYWLLFGPEASWTGGPSPLRASGAPVIDSFDQLNDQLRPWF